NYYANLGVSKNATIEEIKSAFRRLAKEHHPDKKGPNHDGDSTEFRKIHEAYEKLSDPALRAAYD
ncbi:heat shock protein DnaJ, partial [Trematosphaeria pertusa]